MKVLLDECLPRRLKREVNAEFVRTVPEVGWASIKNGALLRLAEQEFDVFVTNDQNLEHQQNLKKFDLAIVVLVALTNDIDVLKPLMPAANEALNKISVGEIVYIRAPAI
jgi:predicted nuclease of predicted toxin-antitoxin system